MSEVIWKPQPKQAEFMARPEYEVLYGGAAGGGKSDALLCEALRQVHIRNYRAIIFRDTVPQLEALINRSHDIYKAAFPKAKYNDNKKVWKFPSGAQIFFGHMLHEKDKLNYQGKPYDFIGFDEVTHFTYSQYMYLMSRNRPMGPGTRVYIRATANPDGKGLGWVKQRFITPAPPKTPIKAEYDVYKPDGTSIKMTRTRMFIPASVFDNQELLNNDPNYLATLASLPEAERNALLYGSWDSFSGQVFTEWKNDPAHYDDRKWTHIINPFKVPEHWRIYQGFDFGYAKPSAAVYFAVDDRGKIYQIGEYYFCTDTPNTGTQDDPVSQAVKLRNYEEEHQLLKGKRITRIADPAIFDESRGESVARMMSRSPNFLIFEKGDHKRLPGKMQFHYRFAFDKEGDCMYQIFNTCKGTIRTLPNLVYSTTHFEDIDTEQEDHLYDAIRYVLMEHPITPRINIDRSKEILVQQLDIRNKDTTPVYEPINQILHYKEINNG